MPTASQALLYSGRRSESARTPRTAAYLLDNPTSTSVSASTSSLPANQPSPLRARRVTVATPGRVVEIQFPAQYVDARHGRPRRTVSAVTVEGHSGGELGDVLTIQKSLQSSSSHRRLGISSINDGQKPSQTNVVENGTPEEGKPGQEVSGENYFEGESSGAGPHKPEESMPNYSYTFDRSGQTLIPTSDYYGAKERGPVRYPPPLRPIVPKRSNSEPDISFSYKRERGVVILNDDVIQHGTSDPDIFQTVMQLPVEDAIKTRRISAANARKGDLGGRKRRGDFRTTVQEARTAESRRIRFTNAPSDVDLGMGLGAEVKRSIDVIDNYSSGVDAGLNHRTQSSKGYEETPNGPTLASFEEPQSSKASASPEEEQLDMGLYSSEQLQRRTANTTRSLGDVSPAQDRAGLTALSGTGQSSSDLWEHSTSVSRENKDEGVSKSTDRKVSGTRQRYLEANHHIRAYSQEVKAKAEKAKLAQLSDDSLSSITGSKSRPLGKETSASDAPSGQIDRIQQIQIKKKLKELEPVRVCKTSKPPRSLHVGRESQGLVAYMEYPGTSLTHRQVKASIQRVISSYKDARITMIQFIPRNVILGVTWCENAWLVSLDHTRAFDTLVARGVILQGEQVKVRRYADVLREEHQRYLENKEELEEKRARENRKRQKKIQEASGKAQHVLVEEEGDNESDGDDEVQDEQEEVEVALEKENLENLGHASHPSQMDDR